ncbi:MAG: TfuA-like protein [Dongiaceae bacterium]
MTVVVFLGPTLAVDEARAILDAEYLPPAGHGDLYRVARRDPPPRIIAIVDGYFQSAPAVRHKEILWAMSRGVHVFGAASIGALRACELNDFGMVGVGAIFEAYRDGTIEDDDEVAVEHGPAAVGYVPLCEPMVNIRTTLDRARGEAIISAAVHDELVRRVKDVFYKQRSYECVIKVGSEAGVSPEELTAFQAWLPRGRVDQKRNDAVALLERLRNIDASKLEPFQPAFRFEEAEIWQADMEAAPGMDAHGHPREAPSREAILDELRLIPGEYAKLRREALTLALAIRTWLGEGGRIGVDDRQAAARDLRRELALGDRRAFEEWLDRNHLNTRGFAELIDQKAMLRRTTEIAEPLINRHLIDALRLSGRYERLAARAARKSDLAGDAGLPTDVPIFQLILWFFSHRLGCDPPHSPEQFALEQGFADVDAFHRSLRREHALWRHDADAGGGK